MRWATRVRNSPVLVVFMRSKLSRVARLLSTVRQSMGWIHQAAAGSRRNRMAKVARAVPGMSPLARLVTRCGLVGYVAKPRPGSADGPGGSRRRSRVLQIARGLAPLETLEQLDLPGVVEVMGGYAVDVLGVSPLGFRRFGVQTVGREHCDRFS